MTASSPLPPPEADPELPTRVVESVRAAARGSRDGRVHVLPSPLSPPSDALAFTRHRVAQSFHRDLGTWWWWVWEDQYGRQVAGERAYWRDHPQRVLTGR